MKPQIRRWFVLATLLTFSLLVETPAAKSVGRSISDPTYGWSMEIPALLKQVKSKKLNEQRFTGTGAVLVVASGPAISQVSFDLGGKTTTVTLGEGTQLRRIGTSP